MSRLFGRILFAVAVLWILGASAPLAQARIKLATLPQRERVEIQLDNGQYTLVEEERIVPLLASGARTGNNMIDFSWSNTQIDKDSIQFRPLAVRQGDEFRPIRKVKLKGGDEVEEVNVLNVAYPPGENALVWEVYAHEACAAKVRVSYLIANLTRSFSYRALADKDETKLSLRNFLQVRNYSGEEFGSTGVWAGFGGRFEKQVGGQEDIKMLLHRFSGVPIEKTYAFDWYAHGALNPDKPFASRVLMHYELVNDEKHGMGRFPLQPGKVRIFIEDGRGGEAFLGEDNAPLVPLDDTMRLYLGEARDIVCTRMIESNERRVLHDNLVDQEIVVKYEIENFKDKACTLRIREQMNAMGNQFFGNIHGDVEWELGSRTSDEIRITSKEGGVLPVLHVDLPARPKDPAAPVTKTVVRFHFTIKNLWP